MRLGPRELPVVGHPPPQRGISGLRFSPRLLEPSFPPALDVLASSVAVGLLLGFLEMDDGV